MRAHRARILIAAMAVAVGVVTVAAPAAAADVIEIEGTLGGQDLAESGPDDPVAIDPNEPSPLALRLTNTGTETVEVGHVRLIGKMLGITFLGYDVSTALSIAPGETREVQFPVDLFDLDGQGHGYLRTEIGVFTAERDQLGSVGFATDVRGRPLSTMGVFAVLLLAITVGTALWNLWGVSRRSLPVNAFQRGLRFAITGLALGLTIAVAFSVLRVFPLPSTSWVPLALVPTLIAFAIGYVSPAPAIDLREDDDEDLIDLSDEPVDLSEPAVDT